MTELSISAKIVCSTLYQNSDGIANSYEGGEALVEDP